jgi:hypothetical protein
MLVHSIALIVQFFAIDTTRSSGRRFAFPPDDVVVAASQRKKIARFSTIRAGWRKFVKACRFMVG